MVIQSFRVFGLFVFSSSLLFSINSARADDSRRALEISEAQHQELKDAYGRFLLGEEARSTKIQLPFQGQILEASVKPVSVLAPNFRAEMEIAQGKRGASRVEVPRPTLKHFRGTISSSKSAVADSSPYIAFSILEDASGVEKLTGVLAPEGTREYSLTASGIDDKLLGEISLLPTDEVTHDADALDIGFSLPPSAHLPGLMRNGPNPILEIAFEADQTYVNYVGANNVQARVETLVNLINPKFQPFNLTIQISYLHLWSTPDPYNIYDSLQRLNAFMSYWQQNFTSVARDHAHLLSVRASNNYGHTLFNTPCFSYSFSIDASTTLGPTLVAHEIGHSLGAGHPSSCWGNGISDIMCGSSTYPINAANFGLVAQNNIGNIVNSRPACFFSEGGIPYVYYAPSNVSVDAGQRATFGVQAQGGVPSIYQYQWQRNGVDIAGATSPQFSIPVTTMADNGATFQVRISNAAGSVVSTSALLTVRGSLPVYKADFNHDSVLSVDDLFLFLNAWFQQSPASDFDHNGIMSIDDLFLFLNAWFGQTMV